MRKVIISLAPVEAGKPIDKNALVNDVINSVRAGASMCHLHSRDEEGGLTPDITELVDTFEKIIEQEDVVIQASTGGISNMSIEERCNPLNYQKVETASLNGGSTNLGEAVYINSFDDIRYCAKAVYERAIIPEIEVFDIGMIYNIELTRKQLPYRNPVLYNLVFGHKGGMQPNMECLTAFYRSVPTDAIWGVTHFGRDNWEFLGAAIALGASVVRIGFEDSHYLAPGVEAANNCQEVEKLVRLIRAMDLEIASPQEARELLNISSRKIQ